MAEYHRLFESSELRSSDVVVTHSTELLAVYDWPVLLPGQNLLVDSECSEIDHVAVRA